MIPVVGVDPGGANTGIVARWNDALCSHALVRLADFPDCYRSSVLDELEYAWRQAVDVARVLLRNADARDARPIVALESVHAPNPHVRVTNVKGILATSEVVGWITERCAQRGYPLIMVRPGGHGAGILGLYPSKLVGPRDTGGGKLKHCRSAWDVAYAGAQLAIRDPSLVVVPSVESRRMDDEPDEKKTTPDDVRRVVERVNLARPLLDAKVVDVVKAAQASGFTPREIIDGSPLSRQRVYQILKPEDTSE